ncbi:hypothetical protein F5876DRAFT_37945 [Lentinula aff. lateritia]|uniref:Uncharacterized protein n=1 Tax=Lentinula aff. lateritia TaxID=2804960 RepID=A0ACC1U5Y6_9AGAR|nr:hypothetical protein F5876DRAFT_37945 [Lentinula aff. lateritia]
MTSTSDVCPHSSLTLIPSQSAFDTGFSWPTAQKRAAAVTLQGRAPLNPSNPAQTLFPAPLVLPEDELSLDPKYPAQSLRSWTRSKERNRVTKEKRTIYVAEPPSVDPNINAIRQWSQPKVPRVTVMSEPRIQEVIDYLTAFYHGVNVKRLPTKLVYTSWNTGKLPSEIGKKHGHIGLNIGSECVRIRTRVSKDFFLQQLNLDDLLDAATSLLPNDAYALLLLVSHDIYENEEDDFACGRAYGGSRIAVVSTARYNPALDVVQNIDREHSWPASHCSIYIQSCCAQSAKSSRKRRHKKTDTKKELEQSSNDGSGPIYAALAAHRALPSSQSPSACSGLWLARVSRTASHELGHCFGIDHCVYYACAMQGTASLAEDARQPPYVCPVDLAKILQACSTTRELRYEALLSFCDKYKDVRHFSAFAAWIRRQ